MLFSYIANLKNVSLWIGKRRPGGTCIPGWKHLT